MSTPLFKVWDKLHDREPDIGQLALEEDWAMTLIYCDMEGWFVDPNGQLILVDECGSYAFPPEGRFDVLWSIQPALP